MNNVLELPHSKLVLVRHTFLNKLRESDILSYVDTVQYSERIDDSVTNVKTGESALEVRIDFTVYEEVSLFASQVKDLGNSEGYFKLRDSKFVVPLSITVTFFSYGDKAEHVGFYCEAPEGFDSRVSRLLNLYFSRTQNGTNLVSNAFSQYNNIIQGAFDGIVTNVEKAHEFTLYGNILDELLLGTSNNLSKICISHEGDKHTVSLELNGVTKTVKLDADKGFSHQLGVLR